MKKVYIQSCSLIMESSREELTYILHLQETIKNLQDLLERKTMEEEAVKLAFEDVKHQLLCANSELETQRIYSDEIERKEDQLIEMSQLVNTVCMERDEARYQILMLLKSAASPTSSSLQPETPEIIMPTRGYLGSTQVGGSSSSSQSHGHGPHFQPASPMLDDGRLDQASAIVDQLAMNRALPEKGKLLQAVLSVGPLLSDVLINSSIPELPQWRIPPPLLRLRPPPATANGHNGPVFGPTNVVNPIPLLQTSLNTLYYEKPESSTRANVH